MTDDVCLAGAPARNGVCGAPGCVCDPTPPCPVTGEDHLDARDAIGRTARALQGLKASADLAHSLTGDEARAFDRVENLLLARASRLHRHAYEAHGVERMTR